MFLHIFIGVLCFVNFYKSFVLCIFVIGDL